MVRVRVTVRVRVIVKNRVSFVLVFSVMYGSVY